MKTREQVQLRIEVVKTLIKTTYKLLTIETDLKEIMILQNEVEKYKGLLVGLRWVISDEKE